MSEHDQMIGALITEIKLLRQRVERMEDRLDQLTTVKNIGVGLVLGLIALAGGAGAVVGNLTKL